MKATPVALFRLLFLSLLTLFIIVSFHYAVHVDGLLSLRKRTMRRLREKRVRLFGEKRSHRHDFLERQRVRYFAERNFLRNLSLAKQHNSIGNEIQHHRKDLPSGSTPFGLTSSKTRRCAHLTIWRTCLLECIQISLNMFRSSLFSNFNLNGVQFLT